MFFSPTELGDCSTSRNHKECDSAVTQLMLRKTEVISGVVPLTNRAEPVCTAIPHLKAVSFLNRDQLGTLVKWTRPLLLLGKALCLLVALGL